jgi:hypothetical protein
MTKFAAACTMAFTGGDVVHAGKKSDAITVDGPKGNWDGVQDIPKPTSNTKCGNRHRTDFPNLSDDDKETMKKHLKEGMEDLVSGDAYLTVSTLPEVGNQ